MDNKINVLSLFDGMSCGQIALNKLGIKIDNYYASEIDKNAIKVAKHNYPNTIHIGDVREINPDNYKHIDLLIGGSPCQGFSSSGKGLNFDDPRSKLFFNFVEIKNAINPKYFLLENVVMKKEWIDIISNYMGVEPIMINSALVSAQSRKRLYWTNIPNVTQPNDRGIKFSDFIDGYSGAIRGRKYLNGIRCDAENIKIQQYIELRKDDKCNCLTTVQKDNIVAYKPIVGITLAKNVEHRNLTRREYEILQTIPIGYTDIVSDNVAKKMIGNAWTVDVITHIFSNMIDFQ